MQTILGIGCVASPEMAWRFLLSIKARDFKLCVRTRSVRPMSCCARSPARRYWENLCISVSSRCQIPATPELEKSGIVSGISALQSIFISASVGTPLKPLVIAKAGQTLVEHIEEHGFADWVRAVRVHHDQTYQHCLLVSGAAAAFSQHLKFNATDRRRVAMAGLLHDIGKAKIPLAILDKPDKLNDDGDGDNDAACCIRP